MTLISKASEVELETIEFHPVTNDFKLQIPQSMLDMNRWEDTPPRSSQLVISNYYELFFFPIKDGFSWNALSVASKDKLSFHVVKLDSTPFSFGLSRDESTLFVATEGTLYGFQAENLLELSFAPTFKLSIDGKVIDIKCGKKGALLLFEDGRLSLFVYEEKALSELQISNSSAIAFEKSEGLWIVATKNGSLQLWDADFTNELFSVEIPQDYRNNLISSMLCLDKERLLAVLSKDSASACELLLFNIVSKEWRVFSDPTRPKKGRKGGCYVVRIPEWSSDLQELILTANFASSDIGSLGRLSAKDELESLFLSSEFGSAQLSVSRFNNRENAYPIGLALDYTNLAKTKNGEKPWLPPSPVMWILSNDGTFCPYRILKRDCLTAHEFMNLEAGKLSIPEPASFTEDQLKSEKKDSSVIVKAPEDRGSVKVSENKEQKKTEMPARPEDLKSPTVVTSPTQSSEPLVESNPYVVTPQDIVIENYGLLCNTLIQEFLTLHSSFSEDLRQLKIMTKQSRVDLDESMKGQKMVEEYIDKSISAIEWDLSGGELMSESWTTLTADSRFLVKETIKMKAELEVFKDKKKWSTEWLEKELEEISTLVSKSYKVKDVVKGNLPMKLLLENASVKLAQLSSSLNDRFYGLAALSGNLNSTFASLNIKAKSRKSDRPDIPILLTNPLARQKIQQRVDFDDEAEAANSPEPVFNFSFPRKLEKNEESKNPIPIAPPSAPVSPFFSGNSRTAMAAPSASISPFSFGSSKVDPKLSIPPIAPTASTFSFGKKVEDELLLKKSSEESKLKLDSIKATPIPRLFSLGKDLKSTDLGKEKKVVIDDKDSLVSTPTQSKSDRKSSVGSVEPSPLSSKPLLDFSATEYDEVRNEMTESSPDKLDISANTIVDNEMKQKSEDKIAIGPDEVLVKNEKSEEKAAASEFIRDLESDTKSLSGFSLVSKDDSLNEDQGQKTENINNRYMIVSDVKKDKSSGSFSFETIEVKETSQVKTELDSNEQAMSIVADSVEPTMSGTPMSISNNISMMEAISFGDDVSLREQAVVVNNVFGVPAMVTECAPIAPLEIKTDAELRPATLANFAPSGAGFVGGFGQTAQLESSFGKTSSFGTSGAVGFGQTSSLGFGQTLSLGFGSQRNLAPSTGGFGGQGSVSFGSLARQSQTQQQQQQPQQEVKNNLPKSFTEFRG